MGKKSSGTQSKSQGGIGEVEKKYHRQSGGPEPSCGGPTVHGAGLNDPGPVKKSGKP